MAFSAARLTCFALLSAIEDDLRTEIESSPAVDDGAHVLDGEVLKRVLGRRPADQRDKPTASIGALLPYLDFADSYSPSPSEERAAK